MTPTENYGRFKERFLEKSEIVAMNSGGFKTTDYTRLIYPRYTHLRVRLAPNGSLYSSAESRDSVYEFVRTSSRRRQESWVEGIGYYQLFGASARAVRFIPLQLVRLQVNSRRVFPPAGYVLRGVGWFS